MERVADDMAARLQDTVYCLPFTVQPEEVVGLAPLLQPWDGYAVNPRGFQLGDPAGSQSRLTFQVPIFPKSSSPTQGSLLPGRSKRRLAQSLLQSPGHEFIELSLLVNGLTPS
jgi:hypothetical protein